MTEFKSDKGSRVNVNVCINHETTLVKFKDRTYKIATANFGDISIFCDSPEALLNIYNLLDLTFSLSVQLVKNQDKSHILIQDTSAEAVISKVQKMKGLMKFLDDFFVLINDLNRGVILDIQKLFDCLKNIVSSDPSFKLSDGIELLEKLHLPLKLFQAESKPVTETSVSSFSMFKEDPKKKAVCMEILMNVLKR